MYNKALYDMVKVTPTAIVVDYSNISALDGDDGHCFKDFGLTSVDVADYILSEVYPKHESEIPVISSQDMGLFEALDHHIEGGYFGVYFDELNTIPPAMLQKYHVDFKCKSDINMVSYRGTHNGDFTVELTATNCAYNTYAVVDTSGNFYCETKVWHTGNSSEDHIGHNLSLGYACAIFDDSYLALAALVEYLPSGIVHLDVEGGKLVHQLHELFPDRLFTSSTHASWTHVL